MAVDIFINIGDIKDEIDVLNWSRGMSQSGNMRVGSDYFGRANAVWFWELN